MIKLTLDLDTFDDLVRLATFMQGQPEASVLPTTQPAEAAVLPTTQPAEPTVPNSVLESIKEMGLRVISSGKRDDLAVLLDRENLSRLSLATPEQCERIKPELEAMLDA